MANARDVADDGGTPVLVADGDGGGQAVTVADDALVYRETGEPVGMDWDERPTLYAEHDADDREKVFWDGDTVVAAPRVADDTLVLEAYAGSYAERLAAQDAVGDYPAANLPLSTNITVVPVVDDGGDPVIPVFYRNDQVAEYPDHFHTVAGGIPDVEMHPIDAGWMEAVEEIRIGPDWDRETYSARDVVDASADQMRTGTIASHDVVTSTGPTTGWRSPASCGIWRLTPRSCAPWRRPVSRTISWPRTIRGRRSTLTCSRSGWTRMLSLTSSGSMITSSRSARRHSCWRSTT